MKSLLIRIAAATPFVFAGLASQSQTYTYQKFSGGPSFQISALEITDDVRVGGFETDYVHLYGFVEQNGKLMTVSVPNASSVEITAIQGNTLYGVADGRGFAMDGSGHVTYINLYQAVPNGVNAKGVVVGSYRSQTVDQGAFVQQNGAISTYSVPGSYDTSFNAVNNKGVIVGTWNKKGAALQSFKLENGQLTPILFPGSYSTIATGINDAGEIVGWYYTTANGPLALFRFDGNSYTQIPTPANSYACSSGHVNNSGDFVGSCSDSKTGAGFAFVATPNSASQQVVLPPQ